MKIPDYRTIEKWSRAVAWASAVAVVLWGVMTTLLMIMDSLTFNDPAVARIKSWPLLLLYAVGDVLSEDLERLADKAREDPMWYKKLGSEE